MSEIELLRPERIADPYPWLSELRRNDPVHYDESLRGWLVSSHALVCDALADRRLSSDTFPEVIRRHIGADGSGPVVTHDTISRWLTFMDPPDHTHLRNAVKMAFTPRVVDSLRPKIAEIATGLVGSWETITGVDLMAEYAFPLPMSVIGDLLGAPRADQPLFRQWSDDIRPEIFISPHAPDRYDRAERGFQGLLGYLKELVQHHRREPGEDLLSRMVIADGDEKLDDDTIAATAAHILFAGHETTTNLIGNSIFTLLRRPELLETLQRDRGQIPSAVEEFLRLESPISLTTRHADEDLSLGGKQIRSGDRVYLMLGAANRDPHAFAEPDELQLDRKPNAHLAFLRNIHFCLGAALARAEGAIALDAIIDRLPKDARDRLEYGWQDELSNRGLTHLRIRA